MANLNISVKQSMIRRLQRELSGKSKAYEKAVTDEVHKSALNIESGAKQNATRVSDEGTLRASIQSELEPAKPSANVHSNLFYAPYIEFGTGRFAASYLADKAADIKRYAMTFFKTGKGTTRTFPFLFPAMDAEGPKLIKRLRGLKL